MRVLVVDDEALSANRLMRLLAETGEVEACHALLNPLDVREYVMGTKVDVAFLDISMPEMSGMQLARSLRESDDSIVVVFVTGYDDYAVEAFEEEAVDYLMKPVNAVRLAQTMRKLKRLIRHAEPEPDFDIRMFNGFQIRFGGQAKAPVKLRSPKTEELFAYLLTKETASRAEIIDTLWSDLEPDKAWKNLNATLYYIRKTISACGTDSWIRSDKKEISIDRNGIRCDLYEFEEVMKQFRKSPETSVDLSRRAETLYAGELLHGKIYDWAADRGRRLERDFLELMDSAARQHLERGQPDQALHCFGRILDFDPMREDIHFEMISIYMNSGRTGEAVRQYRSLEEWLQRELGTKPDGRIQDLIARA